MTCKTKMYIYCWEGHFTPHVADYAYFVVDQLQLHQDLKPWLDKHGGGWLLQTPSLIKHVGPVYNIQKTIAHLELGEKMQLATFVQKHKSALMLKQTMLNTRPLHFRVKLL